MRHTTHREKAGMVVSIKRGFAILLVATFVSAFGAASGCGVQQGQEQIEKARQVQKQAEESQNKLEKQLRE
jgi:hypothetical protein